MNESTARAERFEPQSPTSPSYIWEAPQKPVSVRLPFPVIDRLEKEAVESFRSLSSTGSEIGGLLLGRITAGKPAIVSVEGYESIPCDYTRGPLYRLSEADAARFTQAVQQKTSPGGPVAVGFFRSHTRKGLSLDPDDLAFFQERFQDPNQIALLIRPFATKASLAGIFIWEGGSVHSEASYLEFPFRTTELTPGAVKLPPPEPAAPAKSPSRAQIVPIASRRETPVVVPAPQAIPETPKPTPVSVPAPAPQPEIKAKAEPPKSKAPEPVKAKPIEPVKPKAEEPKAKAEPAKTESKPVESKKEDPKPKAEEPRKPEPPKQQAKPATVVAPAKEAPKEAPKQTPKEAAEKVVIPVPAARSGKMLWIALGGLLSILLIGGLLMFSGVLKRGKGNIPGVPQDASALSLRVERTSNELLLTWNRDAEVIRNATHAVLSIHDGPQNENVDMDLSQLRNGSIIYSPVTSDVVFQMEVTGKDQAKTTTTSVRFLRTRPSAMEAEATPAPAPSSSKPPAPSKSNDAPESIDVAAPAEEEKPAAKAPLKKFNSDSLAQRLRPASPADAIDAPTTVARADSNAPALSALNLRTAAPQMAAPPQPAPSAPVTKVPQQGGKIEQAVIQRRRDPEYPRLAKESGVKGQVELLATVGTDGHVKSVKIIKGHPLLQRAAQDAVMQWIYKPAILNGIAVETQAQIILNFVGDGR